MIYRISSVKERFVGITYDLCHSLSSICEKILNVLKVAWISILQLFSCSPYEVHCLSPEEMHGPMQEQLKAFEQQFDYPLGQGKRFRILHGKGENSYFGFMKQIGDPKVYVAINKTERTVKKTFQENGITIEKEFLCKKGEIAGIACAILRNFPTKEGNKKVWYLCDLKVGEKYREEHIPTRLAQRAFWRYFQCSRGYGIGMDPSDGSLPKAGQIWEDHGPFVPNKAKVNLYSLTAETILKKRRDLEEAFEETISFKSMKGIKEFEIFEENNPTHTQEWKMLHFQHGPLGRPSQKNPLPHSEHLFATLQDSPLDERLKKIERVNFFSTATLFFHGMKREDFENTILTNEI